MSVTHQPADPVSSSEAQQGIWLQNLITCLLVNILQAPQVLRRRQALNLAQEVWDWDSADKQNWILINIL